MKLSKKKINECHDISCRMCGLGVCGSGVFSSGLCVVCVCLILEVTGGTFLEKKVSEFGAMFTHV